MDYTFVNRRVATGASINSANDVKKLTAAGITHVICCCNDYDDATVLQANPSIGYLYNGVPDDGKPKPTDWFQKSIEFALAALSKPHNKVYAHCMAGVNRGPSTAYAILRAIGYSPDRAERLIREKRPQVGFGYKKDADAAIIALGYE